MTEFDQIIDEVRTKESKILCHEVMSITDTMDVLRSKWTVEILTAIICGNTRFKDIIQSVKGISEKVLTEREMLEELRTFVEYLDIDCSFITHHTIAAKLSGPHFLKRKTQILAAIDNILLHGDMATLERIRNNKQTL